MEPARGAGSLLDMYLHCLGVDEADSYAHFVQPVVKDPVGDPLKLSPTFDFVLCIYPL